VPLHPARYAISNDMDDLLREFLTESAENLGKLDNDIVGLERRPNDAALLNGVFRTIHTIKGTCGFLGLPRLEAIAHAAENVLDALRADKLVMNAKIISDVLQAVDSIRGVLEHLAQFECEPEGEDSLIIAALEQHMQGPIPPATVLPLPQDDLNRLNPAAPPSIRVEHVELSETGESVNHRRRKDDLDIPLANADSTLRVGVALLDQLMNLVGELALGRNRLLQLVSAHEDSEFVNPVHQINRITTDLLEAVMKTRMQPIGNAWTKLPRLVRDLSSASGKQITLTMHGADTELDRQILQAIQDPLTHMVRNSADHGIESPQLRQLAGKASEGTIVLTARHEAGHVVIEISDDGAGINLACVRQKAIDRGLAKADAIAAMPDAQVLRFVFEPGFSTAAQVTNISGRGVGMDVVRSNIETIGGTVDLFSRDGLGTTVRVRIPLTMAIISALLVGAGGETFAELVGVTEERHGRVETINGAHFYRLRDSLLPLVSLQGILRLPSAEMPVDYNIVVCQVGSLRYGLVVQEVFDTQEIVVKPVGRLARTLQVYAGCTITGDGRVIMILDNAGVAAAAGVANGDSSRAEAERTDRSPQVDLETSTESFILFDAGFPSLQAVPLSRVSRLEEFPQSSIEEANGQYLVQYRGALLPIVMANPANAIRSIDPRPVLVFTDNAQSVGVAVDEIRDIVDAQIQLQRRVPGGAVSGVCIIAGRATEIVEPGWFLEKTRHSTPSGAVNGPSTFALDEYLAASGEEEATTTVRNHPAVMQAAA
jgi:two-component system, chemotaxis family, sensor kinase CheA